jgi:hypothetical protein
MVRLLSFTAGCLVLLHALVAGSPLHTELPRYFQANPLTRRNLMVNTVEKELGPHLSKGSLIFGSSNAAYANLTSYWITYIQPDFEVIVEVAAESDISKVVSNVAMQRLIVHAGLLEYAYRFDIAVTTASTSS